MKNIKLIKYIFLLSVFILSYICSFSQAQIPRSSPSVTVADARQKVLLNFYLPRGNTLTINSGLDSSGMIFFYKPDSSIYTRIGQDVGANSWMRLLSIKDTNTILASQAWVINHGTGAVEVVTSGSVENVADLRNVSGGAGSPFSRINGETNTVINLLGWYTKNDGGGGTFYWDDTSSMADNGGTIIDPPGAGTWKRITGSVFNVLWFGAKADGVFDNLAIFNTVETVAAAAKGSIIYIPGSGASAYYLSGTWVIDQNVKVLGDEWSSNYMATKLIFAANVIGIKIPTYFNGTGANMADLNNLALTGSGSDTTAHGIWTNTRYNFNNIYVGEFGGSGFRIQSAAAPDSGNANIGIARNVFAFYNGMNGIHISGSDANGSYWDGSVDVRTNRRTGILDESQHGNMYDGIHVDANGQRTGQNSVATHPSKPGYYYVAKYFNVAVEPNVTAGWQTIWHEVLGTFGYGEVAWAVGTTYAPSASIRTQPNAINKSIFRGYIEGGQGPVLLGAGAKLEVTTGIAIADFTSPVLTITDQSWAFNGLSLYVRDTTTGSPQNVYLSNVSGLTTSGATGIGYKGFPDEKLSRFFIAGLNPNLLQAMGFTHIGWSVSKFNRDNMDGFEAGYPIVFRTLGFQLYDSFGSFRHLGMAVTRPDSGYGPAVMGPGDIFFHVGQNSNIIGWRKKLNGWDTLYSGSWGAANANNIYNIDGTIAGNRTVAGNAKSLTFNNVSTYTMNVVGTGGSANKNGQILIQPQLSQIYSEDLNSGVGIVSTIQTNSAGYSQMITQSDEQNKLSFISVTLDSTSIFNSNSSNEQARQTFYNGLVKFAFNGVEKIRFSTVDALARIGVNTSNPRDIIDAQGGRIVGGTNVNSNPIDLSSQAAYPAVKQSFTDDNYIETGSAGDSTKTFFKSFNNKSGFYFDFTSNGVDKPVQFKINGTEAFRIDSLRNFIFGNGGEENYTTYKADFNGTVRFRDIPFLATRDTLLTIEPSTGQLKKTLLSFNLDTSRTSTQATISNPYGNDAIILGATQALAGLMSAEDKRRSDSIKTINNTGNLDEILISPDPLTLYAKSIRVTGSGVTPTITDSTVSYTISSGAGLSVGDINSQPKSDDGISFVAGELIQQTSEYTKPGLQTGLDKKRFDKGSVIVADNSTVADEGIYYDAFPNTTANRDTAYVEFKRAFGHVPNGRLMIMKSVGGNQWDSVNVLHTDGNNGVITHVGGDTILFNYDRAGTYNYFGYTTNGFRTINITDSIDIALYFTLCFDKFLKLKSGNILLPYYNINATNYQVGVLRSTDGGLHWSTYVIIAQGTIDTTELNEITWDIINEPASDADTKILAAIRDEQGNGHQQWISSNGGANWNYVGKITQFDSPDDAFGFPLYVQKYFGDVYLIGGRRTNYEGSNSFYHVAVSRGNPDSVFSDPTNWSTPNIIHQSEPSYAAKGNPYDFGYTDPYIINGHLRVAAYDVSPKMIYGDDTTRTTIFTLPITGVDGMELFNNVNQSITASTETLVSFPDIFLNAGYSYSAGLISPEKSGWYNIQAEATYQANVTGTYRKLYLVVINPGYATANRIVREIVIQPTTNQEFLKMAISAPATYVRSGEKVAVYTMHDGGAENLRNQNEVKYRAKFSMKKINN